MTKNGEAIYNTCILRIMHMVHTVYIPNKKKKTQRNPAHTQGQKIVYWTGGVGEVHDVSRQLAASSNPSSPTKVTPWGAFSVNLLPWRRQLMGSHSVSLVFIEV